MRNFCEKLQSIAGKTTFSLSLHSTSIHYKPIINIDDSLEFGKIYGDYMGYGMHLNDWAEILRNGTWWSKIELLPTKPYIFSPSSCLRISSCSRPRSQHAKEFSLQSSNACIIKTTHQNALHLIVNCVTLFYYSAKQGRLIIRKNSQKWLYI